MSKTKIVSISVVVLLVVVFMGSCTKVVNTLNSEAVLKNLVVAKQKDNHSQLDNTIKTIKQTAQVTDAQTEALKSIIVGHAEARSGNGGGSLAKLVHESVPNIDSSTDTFRNLMNIIAAERASWTRNQKELLDLKREHDNMFDQVLSGFILSTFNRAKVDVVIVTSTRTEKAFSTGVDDDMNVFE